MLDGEVTNVPPVCPDCDRTLAYEVLHSNAGFYIGTFCPQDGPYSRESDYFRSSQAAAAEMELWMEGVRPSGRTPGYQSAG